MATTSMTVRCRDYSWQGALNMSTDVHNIALYNGSGHSASTDQFTVTSEVVGSGYVSKGKTLAGFSQTVDTGNRTVYLDWTDVQWTSATFTTTDCMIFADNVVSPAADPALYIGDFNGSKTVSAGTFTVQFPNPAFNTAVLRFA